MIEAGDRLADYNLKPEGYYESSRHDMMVFVPSDISKALEFGCGTGGFLHELKQRFGAETWAVEINKEAAESASKLIDTVINKDAMQALDDLPNNYFDCILFFDILEHLVNPYELLLKLKAKLSGNGVIICSIPNIRYYRAFASYVFKGDWEYKDHGVMDKTHLRFFTKKSLKNMFAKLQYEILEIKGMHPVTSRSYKLLNLLSLNRLSDLRYKHFAVVAKPQ